MMYLTDIAWNIIVGGKPNADKTNAAKPFMVLASQEFLNGALNFK